MHYGGQTDAQELYISPTIVSAAIGDVILQGEIFGPILPIVTVKSIDDAIEIVNAGEKPLACYVFSRNTSVVERILHETSCGGVTVNDCILHFACESPSSRSFTIFTLQAIPSRSAALVARAWAATTASTASARSATRRPCCGSRRRWNS